MTPNLAIIPELHAQGIELHYVGRKTGIEKDLLETTAVTYHSITAGKLRRYFDWKNFTDLALIFLGFLQALKLLLVIRPQLIFSKGGFVSCPVVWAGWLLRIPVIIHESDLTPGLANKLSAPFATKICYSFPETIRYLPDSKAVMTGIPVRESLLSGDSQKGKSLCEFDEDKPVILIIGGSLGSRFINQSIRQALPSLLKKYQICHICGQGNIDSELVSLKGYCQFEYVSDELPHFFAMADGVISRAGATTLFELLALKKPSLLIPLPLRASRGDQILNAQSFKKQELCLVLSEGELTEENLVHQITELLKQKRRIEEKIVTSKNLSGSAEIINIFKTLI